MYHIKPSVKIQNLKGHGWNFEKFNRIRQRNSLLLHQFEDKTCSELGFEILERERVTSL